MCLLVYLVPRLGLGGWGRRCGSGQSDLGHAVSECGAGGVRLGGWGCTGLTRSPGQALLTFQSTETTGGYLGSACRAPESKCRPRGCQLCPHPTARLALVALPAPQGLCAEEPLEMGLRLSLGQVHMYRTLWGILCHSPVGCGLLLPLGPCLSFLSLSPSCHSSLCPGPHLPHASHLLCQEVTGLLSVLEHSSIAP